MLGQFLVRFRKGSPSSFAAFFGPDHIHLWASLYSKPTATSALWQDEGFGLKNAVEIETDTTKIPSVGTINGKTFPLFFSQDSAASDHLQATPFNSLDGSDNYTLYGAFVAFKANYGGQNVKLMWQAGSWEVSTFFDSGTGKIHLQVSILNGLQFTPVIDESVTDDGLLHKWVFTVVAGVGRLYMDGVQLGSDVPGLPTIVTDSDPVEFGGNNFWGSITGGIYLSGIATKGLNALEVGQLFGLMDAYIGTVDYPTLGTPSPVAGSYGSTISIMGTNFTPGARVFFRDIFGGFTWIEGDNTTFIDDTQIDVDIPLGLAIGALDVWVLNGNGLWAVEEDIVTIIPESFNDLFGADDAFRWGHLYSQPTGTSALWENEGTNGGWDATEQDANSDKIPLVGMFAGSPFPWFESFNSGWDGLWTAEDFDGLDDQDNATFYFAFSTLGVAEGAADGVIFAQAGRFVFYLWWAGDDRMHLRASIDNGDQWTPDDATTLVDDRAVHIGVCVINGDEGKLFLDGVQIGPTITGLTGAFASNNVNRVRFGRNNFEAPMGGVYVAGIALKSLSDLEVGFLFDLVDDYIGGVGAETAPDVTGTTPATASEGETISVDGTGFIDGALVFFRQNGGTPSAWVRGDNINFVDSTEIEVDVPAGLPDGDLDVMVINPTALYDNELAAFEKITFTLTAIGYTNQFDTLGGEFFQVNGTGFLAAGITDVQVDGVSCPTFLVADDTIIWARAPACTAGVKDVSVIGSTTQTLTSAVEVWDPTVESTLGLLIERGGYGEAIGTPQAGIKWTLRAGTSDYVGSSTDAVTTPFDDQQKEPRLKSADSLFLSCSNAINTQAGGITNSDPRTIAIGFSCPNAPAAGTHVYQDPEPLLHEQGGGTEFAIGFSDGGFGAACYDNGAFTWKSARIACAINHQSIGIVTHTPSSLMKTRVNGSSWTNTVLSGESTFALATYLGTNYTGTVFGNSRVRFFMVAETAWDDTLCGKLDKWYAYRHGGNRDANSGAEAPNDGQLWYVDSDVIHRNSPNRVTIKGKNLNVSGLQIMFINDGGMGFATEVAIHDDNTISCKPPSLSAGKTTIAVFGVGLAAQIVDAVEYFNPTADRSFDAWWRPSSALRTTSGSAPTLVTEVREQNADTSRYMSGPSTGAFGTGATAPRLFAADPRFGGQDTCGGFTGELKNLGHDSPASPISQPATLYHWVRPAARTVAAGRALYAIKNDGADTAGFSGYFNDTLGYSNSGIKVNHAPGGVLGQAFCAVAQYGGAAAECYIAMNDWLKGDTLTSGSNRTEDTLSIGLYPGELRLGWAWAARFMASGLDAYDLRRKMLRWGENFFQIGACDLDKFPDLVFAYRQGDATDDYGTGGSDALLDRAWFPSGGDVAGYNDSHKSFHFGAGNGFTLDPDTGALDFDNTTAMISLGGGSIIAPNNVTVGATTTGDFTLVWRGKWKSGGIIGTGTGQQWLNNDNLLMDGGGYVGIVAKRTGSPGSYQYWAGLYFFGVNVPTTPNGVVSYVEVTSLVDANGEGELTIIGMRQGDVLYVSANGGTFTTTVTLPTAEPLGQATNQFRVGGPYNTAQVIHRAVMGIRRAISQGEAYHIDKRLRY